MTAQLLNQACDSYRNGDWQAAESICQNLVNENSENIEALHLLAAISHARRDYKGAVEFGLRSVAIAPDVSSIHNNLGASYRELGRSSEAINCFERALKLEPNSAGTHHNLGSLYESQNDLRLAEDYYQRSLKCDPGFLGAAQNLGRLLTKQGRVHEAIDVYRSSIAVQPNAFAIHFNLGNALAADEQYEQAIESYEDALRLAPNVADIHNNMGTTWKALGKFESAHKSFEHAVQLAPDHANAVNNLGSMLQFFGQFTEATQCFRRALELNPNLVDTHLNLANIAADKNDFATAEHEFGQALLIDPNSAETRFNQSLAWLRAGNSRRGWASYETRFLKQVQKRDFGFLRWNGESLEEKRILAYGEQGLGDEVMFASCLPDLIERSQRCVVECEDRLAALFQRSFPQAKVVPRSAFPSTAQSPELKSIDFQVSLGSLPQFLRISDSEYPAKPSYLIPDENAVVKWQQRLNDLGSGLKIGISWQGGAEPAHQFKRSTSLKEWKPVLQTTGTRFVSLQHGDVKQQASQFNSETGLTIQHWDDVAPMNDVDNFAALISALDMVISVDNSTVHLAGALGTTVWTLLPYAADWRWMNERDSTPWYPCMRLWRQTKVNRWDDLFDRVANELSTMASTAATVLPSPEDNKKPLTEALAIAIGHHESGQLQSAESAYNSIIGRWPDCADAWHLSGLIALQSRQPLVAIARIGKAIQLAPTSPTYFKNIAQAYQTTGDQTAVVDSYQKSLAIDGSQIDVRFALAIALSSTSQHQLALEEYERLLQQQPDHVPALLNLGGLCTLYDEVDQAEAHFRRAIEIGSNYQAEALGNLGVVLQKQERFRESLDVLKEACQLAPMTADHHYNLANSLSKQKQFKSAEESFLRAIELLPNHLDARINLAQLYHSNGNVHQAMSALNDAINECPQRPDAYINLGTLHHELSDMNRAKQCYQQAIQVDSQSAGAYTNLGMLLAQMRDTQAALKHLDHALSLDSKNANAHFYRGTTLLLDEKFSLGWDEYKYRWQRGDLVRREFPFADWQGQPLAEKHLLIDAEQGIGDEIMFASCLTDAINIASKVTVTCDERLVALYSRSFPEAHVVSKSLSAQVISQNLAADYQTTIGTLPSIFRRLTSDFPETNPGYFVPDAKQVAEWQTRLQLLNPGKRIGFSWRGASDSEDKQRRSISLDLWSRLVGQPNTNWICLQYGNIESELQNTDIESHSNFHRFVDLDLFNNIDGLAALISCLDLVVTVDNVTAHLAGALGIPVCTLLPFSSDWRWQVNRQTSLWYPNMQLIRQTKDETWESTLERVQPLL